MVRAPQQTRGSLLQRAWLLCALVICTSRRHEARHDGRERHEGCVSRDDQHRPFQGPQGPRYPQDTRPGRQRYVCGRAQRERAVVGRERSTTTRAPGLLYCGRVSIVTGARWCPRGRSKWRLWTGRGMVVSSPTPASVEFIRAALAPLAWRACASSATGFVDAGELVMAAKALEKERDTKCKCNCVVC